MAMEMGAGVPPSSPLETETLLTSGERRKASLWKVPGGSRSVATMKWSFSSPKEISPQVCLMRRPDQNSTANSDNAGIPKTILIGAAARQLLPNPAAWISCPPIFFSFKTLQERSLGPGSQHLPLVNKMCRQGSSQLWALPGRASLPRIFLGSSASHRFGEPQD